MYKLSGVLVLLLMTSLAAMTPAPLKACSGLAWTGTIYYSDAQKTHVVGSCSIICQQFVAGTASPQFSDGGTCSGVYGPYQTLLFQTCPCRN